MAEKRLIPWWRLLWLRFRLYWLAPWWQGIQLGFLLLRHKEMEPLALDYLRTYNTMVHAMDLSTQTREAEGSGLGGPLTYGETPWTTFMTVLEYVPIGPQDVFVDLGCGAGFLCLLVAKVYHIPVLGVDLIPGFITRGQRLAAEHGLDNLEFRCDDFTSTDLSHGTIFYITCTCFPMVLMEQLSRVLSRQPSGTWLITVTRPLSGPSFELIKTLSGRYSWGKDEIYLQRVR